MHCISNTRTELISILRTSGVLYSVDLMTTMSLSLKYGGEPHLNFRGKSRMVSPKHAYKSVLWCQKHLHLQNRNSLLSLCAPLQLFCSIRRTSLPCTDHSFQSQYEA